MELYRRVKTVENQHFLDVLKPYEVYHSFLYGWNEQQCHLSVADKVRVIENWTLRQLIPILRQFFTLKILSHRNSYR